MVSKILNKCIHPVGVFGTFLCVVNQHVGRQEGNGSKVGTEGHEDGR
jgi:hypothetical protein